jgi:hypothetical protein
MSLTTHSNPTKATFTTLECDSNNTFTVQYNPKEFKVDKKVSWKELDEQGQNESPLEFQKGSPRTISMELMFDNTHESTPTSVFEGWIKPLLSMTNAEVQPEGETGNNQKERPTTVLFEWGAFEMTGVIESITTTYTLFAADGTPIRAKCQIKMKEFNPEAFSYGSTTNSAIMADNLAGVSGRYDPTNTDSRPNKRGSSPRVVPTTAGQTPQDVANQHNTSPQQICQDNNIDDPFHEFSGEEIIVRPNSGPAPAGDGFDWMGLVEDVVDAARSDDPLGNLAGVAQQNAGALNDELGLGMDQDVLNAAQSDDPEAAFTNMAEGAARDEAEALRDDLF